MNPQTTSVLSEKNAQRIILLLNNSVFIHQDFLEDPFIFSLM